MSKSLLVTGGAGFIASHFIHYIKQKYPDYHIINIDKLTYAGSETNLKHITYSENYDFIEGDIADEQLINDIFSTYDIEGVIHFAAESHVDRSIKDVKAFIQSNVLGTAVLLQAARDAWNKAGELHTRRFHQVSTDEVYGSLELDGGGKFNEQTPYDPRNPYSASKSGADMLVKSFGHTYGMNVVTSSSSNNYGPGQHAEKLIPTIISNALQGNSIPIYGDGKNVRDWLYVTDHCHALDMIFHHGNALEKYNVGGGNEKTNIELAMTICDILDHLRPGHDSYKELITFIGDRKGHDRRYAVDDSKIKTTLGWKPFTTFETGIHKTVEWYVEQWEKIAP
ncbi:dTDP-glucose 4,6-dehydratase [Lentibacillus sp. CBA3610]|uniref:dTDP-glucose 4,6-dehydratase n=1 Tax=Lentibacillus sp. CBA3610 TaxID=2518176 RepID=UPI0015951C22|nr:dTDP-glucose 4,6-dehydratase [Lentibacillus sp. CBA3610]QKY70018.1 dTDP-glucose 4,6-dehydratase [Lentibacillus sp. CBA3610]